MGKISCLICTREMEANQLNFHINAEHLSAEPFRCLKCSFRSPTCEQLESHLVEFGHSDESDRWWMSLANLITVTCDFRAATTDLLSKLQAKKGHSAGADVLASCANWIKFACETAETAGMTEVLKSTEENVNSDQLQNIAGIIFNPLWHQNEIQIGQASEADRVVIESAMVPVERRRKEIGKTQVAQVRSKNQCAYPAARKSGRKRLLSASKSAEELVTEMFTAKRRRIDSTSIRTAHESTVAGQQANLPISTTSLLDNSEKQLESSKSEDEKKVGSMAPSRESAEVIKSDSLAVSTSVLSETPVTSDDVELSMSTLSDRFATTSASTLLPEVIMLMRNQLENARVQLWCQQLIDQYSTVRLYRLKRPLKRSLTEVLLSAVKFHSHDNLIVEKFCQLLWEMIDLRENRREIDWYLGAIDSLLDIIGDENNVTVAARKSVLKLLREIATLCDEKQSESIGQKFVEKICLSMGLQLEKSGYDDFLVVHWNCLDWICYKSVVNQKRFLSAGGIGLFQRCYEKFNDQSHLVEKMTWLIKRLSETKSLRQHVIVDGNLAILWEIWRETKEERISSSCAQIFIYFLSDSTVEWPLGHPTKKEVKRKLNKEEENAEQTG